MFTDHFPAFFHRHSYLRISLHWPRWMFHGHFSCHFCTCPCTHLHYQRCRCLGLSFSCLPISHCAYLHFCRSTCLCHVCRNLCNHLCNIHHHYVSSFPFHYTYLSWTIPHKVSQYSWQVFHYLAWHLFRWSISLCICDRECLIIRVYFPLVLSLGRGTWYSRSRRVPFSVPWLMEQDHLSINHFSLN